MATIKSYSDVQQSKKLAEILPLESADQTWARIAIAGANLDVPEEMQYRHNGDMPFQYYSGIGIPCWSLATLVSVLPRFIEYKGDKYYLRFMKEYIEYANDEVSITGRCLHTTGNNNLVDACYEMVIRLNELKML